MESVSISLLVCIVGAIVYIICELATRGTTSDGGHALLACFSNMGKIAFGAGLLAYLLRP